MSRDNSTTTTVMEILIIIVVEGAFGLGLDLVVIEVGGDCNSTIGAS